MNHWIPSSFAAALSTVALAGCGQAFSLTGGTSGGGGSGGEAAVTAVSVTVGSTGVGGATSSSSEAASSSSTTSGGLTSCDTSENCPDKQYCLKASCSGGATGSCQPVTGIHADFAPVCGCDGITYWNTIYGSASAKAIRKDGPCGLQDKPKVCSAAGVGCSGANEHCALGRNDCTEIANGGTCWVVPDNCELTTMGVDTCEPGNLGQCRRLCSLITQGQAFTATPTCNP